MTSVLGKSLQSFSFLNRPSFVQTITRNQIEKTMRHILQKLTIICFDIVHSNQIDIVVIVPFNDR